MIEALINKTIDIIEFLVDGFPIALLTKHYNEKDEQPELLFESTGSNLQINFTKDSYDICINYIPSDSRFITSIRGLFNSFYSFISIYNIKEEFKYHILFDQLIPTNRLGIIKIDNNYTLTISEAKGKEVYQYRFRNKQSINTNIFNGFLVFNRMVYDTRRNSFEIHTTGHQKITLSDNVFLIIIDKTILSKVANVLHIAKCTLEFDKIKVVIQDLYMDSCAFIEDNKEVYFSFITAEDILYKDAYIPRQTYFKFQFNPIRLIEFENINSKPIRRKDRFYLLKRNYDNACFAKRDTMLRPEGAVTCEYGNRLYKLFLSSNTNFNGIKFEHSELIIVDLDKYETHIHQYTNNKISIRYNDGRVFCSARMALCIDQDHIFTLDDIHFYFAEKIIQSNFASIKFDETDFIYKLVFVVQNIDFLNIKTSKKSYFVYDINYGSLQISFDEDIVINIANDKYLASMIELFPSGNIKAIKTNSGADIFFNEPYSIPK